jgi:hypothetical protein
MDRILNDEFCPPRFPGLAPRSGAWAERGRGFSNQFLMIEFLMIIQN